MALIARKTPEEREQRRLERERERAVRERENARLAFLATPPGRARAAFERGDLLFQYGASVEYQAAIVVPMLGAATAKRTADPGEILNAVCREGWELVNGSFVFVQQRQQSRDKFMSSGQNIAIEGTVAGYYLFRRSEESRERTSDPWDAEEIVDDAAASAAEREGDDREEDL